MEHSMLEAALPRDTPSLDIDGAMRRLREHGAPIRTVEPEAVDIEHAIWQLTMTLEDDTQLTVYSRSTEQRLYDVHLALGRLSESARTQVRDCRYSVGITGRFQPDRHPLNELHLHLKLLHAVAPEATALVDLSACDARSRQWFIDVVSSTVPPHPDYLFSIHAVSDGDGPMWLHTHGLARCGVVDLDIVDVDFESGRAMSHLLRSVAKMFIDGLGPEPNESFQPGRGMSILWLPVERGVQQVNARCLGGAEDRDEDHTRRRGLLFRVKQHWLMGQSLASVESYAELLYDNPLLYVSNIETERMTALAAERLPRFRKLFEQLNDHPAFRFLVKLGYPSDKDAGREHLWFLVHGFRGDLVEGTLENQPYDVSELNKGDRGLHALELLSDFVVLGPFGMLNPDQLTVVEQLAASEDSLRELREAVLTQLES